MSLSEIRKSVRNIPDFPKKGIQFKDITTSIKDAKIFAEIIDSFAEKYKDVEVDYIAGVESRGFIFGSALAHKLQCGFVPIRKAGKLPADTISEEYDLEYGSAKIEVHKDSFHKGAKVLIIDDLLATGGTVRATCNLIEKTDVQIVGIAFMIELLDLKGREKLHNYEIFSLLEY